MVWSTTVVSLAASSVFSSVFSPSVVSVGVVVEVSGSVVAGSVAVAKTGLLIRLMLKAVISRDKTILFNHLPIAI